MDFYRPPGRRPWLGAGNSHRRRKEGSLVVVRPLPFMVENVGVCCQTVVHVMIAQYIILVLLS